MLFRKAILLMILLLIAACTVPSSTGFSVPTPTVISPIPANSILDNVGTPPPPTPAEAYLGELYLLLSTISPPFTYQLGYFPAHCLLTTAFPELEILPGFLNQENEYSPLSEKPLYWSLYGKQALMFNPNKSQLLSFTPHNKMFQVLADNLDLITGQIKWAPDSQWAAVDVQVSDCAP